MIYVTHNGNDRCSRKLGIIGIGGDQLLELLFDDHFLKRHKADIKSKIVGHLARHFFADRLI